MEHAWLDSLEEDWVSQPPTIASAAQLPSLSSMLKNRSPSPSQSPRPSRIPRRLQGPGAKLSSPSPPPIPSPSPTPNPNPNLNTSLSILGEQTPSDINIARQRVASQWARGHKASGSRALSQTLSDDSNGSVVRHSKGLRSPSADDRFDTPEWKRRLVYGDVQYGEHVDLFSSAATGLQDMFRPPEPSESRERYNQAAYHDNSTMPSSPPIPRGLPDDGDLQEILDDEEADEDDDEVDQELLNPDQVTPSPSPRRRQRQVRYKLNDGGGGGDDDDNEDSIGVSFLSNGSLHPPPAKNRPRQPSYRQSSALSIPLGSEIGSRKPSDARHELFSPILLGRHDDEDGKVDFAPLEMPAEELHKRLERLRLSQIYVDGSSDPSIYISQPAREPIFRVEDFEGFGQSGAILSIGRRGGSQRPFAQRSASPEMEFSTMLPEESIQASTPKQFPTVRSERPNPLRLDVSLKSPPYPPAPNPSPEKKPIPGPAIVQPGSSPLKLFGPYDTFTSQTLLRRISQFEEAMSPSSSPSPGGDPDGDESPVDEEELPRARTVSHFGAGDLEGYEFSGDLSYVGHDESGFSTRPGNASPRSPVTPGFMFGQASFLPRDEDSELQVDRRRQNPTVLSAINHLEVANDQFVTRTPRHGSDKRPRTTPSKDPTPKRRRTLHRSDVAFGNEIRLSGVDSAHRQIQLIVPKGSRDPSRGPLHLVDGQALRRKPLLRHRTSSPSPTPCQGREQQSTLEMPRIDGLRKTRASSKNSQGDQHAATAATTTTTATTKPVEKVRKPSIQTQDFVDQAAQIMAMIRNQVSQPGLTSLVESDGESGLPAQAGNGDAVSDDSTSEPLSRPPSREGKPVSWFRQRQGDPELVDRLKKYQELSDMGDVISSSVRSMGLAKDAIRAAQEVERMIERSSRGTSGGDAPSTSADRVVSGSSSNARRSTGSSCESANGDSRSHSGGRSTSHTFPSGSSRSSESRRIIMPESVSHLIPDNIGGMYLDKQNNIWIKKKGQRGPVSHVVPCDDSEEDPFASIPDLTVDITKELRQLKTHSFIEDEDDDEGVEGEGEGEEAGDDEDEDEAEDEDDGDDEREPKGDASCDSPSLAQLHEDCTDQARNVGMAARAVGELRKLDPLVGRSAATKGEEPEQRFDRSYEKMRVTPQAARRRNLTISFSSPIASIIQDMLPEDLDSLDDDPVVFEGQGAAAAMTPSPPPRPPPPVFSSGRKMGQLPSRPRKPPRFSPARRSFIPRPVSRIDEQEEEESTVELGAEIGRDNQLSVIHDKSLIGQKSPDNGLTVFLQRTPSRTSLALQNDDSLLIGQNIGRLSLTPLSEFTLNHPDQSFGFEVSYVMDHRHMATGNGSKRVLSMTIRELVDKLAEVEPYEPYWEDLTQLDLHDKQLTSLHMLDEFCGKVTALDASGNALPHLEGIPSGVRQLKVSHNMLTELTSWNHLLNLQYVDISGNEVKSLSALRGLVHLRSLRADQNRLTSLDGLDSHDGLLSLRARHNLIEELDLRKTRLERLEELDLEGNCIETVRGLEALPALVSLNLSGNQLERLVIEKPVRALRSLIVSDNDLASLDIRNVPNLQTLHVDGNRIQELTGFRYVRRIDSLSMREQRTDEPLNLGFLSHAYEVRKLFLSGNYLKSFEPRADFLNLQLLELANCGLQSLPAELGQMMPNLRALNLNFNAISDLSPLQYIPRLKKLFVAGNRLVDSTLVTELLTDFPHLTQLDMRDNPITQGFYPPLQVLVNPDKVGGSGAGAAAAAAAAAADPFMLTGLDPERDSWFFRLLDEPTKLRRRLHEVVFVASCKRLRKLDGLPIERGDILARDPLLQALIDEGLVPELDDTLVADSSTGSRIRESLPAPGDTTAGADGEADERESSRWQAEDSFA